MRVLIETRLNALRLNESKQPRKGCLGHLEGVCADFKNPTRNGRLYPLELWKKVFDDSIFKESLENHTLFGELDHPEDRFEPLMKKACIVMTDYSIDEKEGLIYGGFDILDTPDGRILKSILDYGSVVGVSSRGQGDIIESADGERVDEDSYEFACFDVVSTPAVEKARQSVSESMKKETFKESVERQIKDAETVSDLNIIRSVVRTSDMTRSDMDTIIESIEDKCKSIQNGENTILPESVDAEEKQVVLESAKTIRDNKNLYRCISELKSRVSAYKHRESRYIESLSKYKSEVDELRDKLDKSDRRCSMYSEKLKTYKSDMRSLNETIENSKEDSTKQTKLISEKNRKIKQVNDEINRLTSVNEQLSSDLAEMKLSLSEQSDKLAEKTNTINELRNQIDLLESQRSISENKYQSEINSIDDEVNDYVNLLDEARDKISEYDSELKSIKESLSTEKKKRTDLIEAYKSLQDSYIKKSCTISGLNYDEIRQCVSNGDSAKKIDTIVESRRKHLDKYNNLPISSNGISFGEGALIESIRKPTKQDVEDVRLDAFLENTQKSL